VLDHFEHHRAVECLVGEREREHRSHGIFCTRRVALGLFDRGGFEVDGADGRGDPIRAQELEPAACAADVEDSLGGRLRARKTDAQLVPSSKALSNSVGIGLQETSRGGRQPR
jgi:hypothetical protein